MRTIKEVQHQFYNSFNLDLNDDMKSCLRIVKRKTTTIRKQNMIATSREKEHKPPQVRIIKKKMDDETRNDPSPPANVKTKLAACSTTGVKRIKIDTDQVNNLLQSQQNDDIQNQGEEGTATMDYQTGDKNSSSSSISSSASTTNRPSSGTKKRARCSSHNDDDGGGSTSSRNSHSNEQLPLNNNEDDTHSYDGPSDKHQEQGNNQHDANNKKSSNTHVDKNGKPFYKNSHEKDIKYQRRLAQNRRTAQKRRDQIKIHLHTMQIRKNQTEEKNILLKKERRVLKEQVSKLLKILSKSEGHLNEHQREALQLVRSRRSQDNEDNLVTSSSTKESVNDTAVIDSTTSTSPCAIDDTSSKEEINEQNHLLSSHSGDNKQNQLSSSSSTNAVGSNAVDTNDNTSNKNTDHALLAALYATGNTISGSTAIDPNALLSTAQNRPPDYMRMILAQQRQPLTSSTNNTTSNGAVIDTAALQQQSSGALAQCGLDLLNTLSPSSSSHEQQNRSTNMLSLPITTGGFVPPTSTSNNITTNNYPSSLVQTAMQQLQYLTNPLLNGLQNQVNNSSLLNTNASTIPAISSAPAYHYYQQQPNQEQPMMVQQQNHNLVQHYQQQQQQSNLAGMLARAAQNNNSDVNSFPSNMMLSPPSENMFSIEAAAQANVLNSTNQSILAQQEQQQQQQQPSSFSMASLLGLNRNQQDNLQQQQNLLLQQQLLASMQLRNNILSPNQRQSYQQGSYFIDTKTLRQQEKIRTISHHDWHRKTP